jgi:hypothetical protein
MMTIAVKALVASIVMTTVILKVISLKYLSDMAVDTPSSEK